MRIITITLILMLSLTACEDAGYNADRMEAAEMAMAPPAPAYGRDDSIVVTGSRAKADAGGGQMGPAPEPEEGRMLAYEYSAELQLPAETVSPLMKEHMARCQAAGTRACQVISSNTGDSGEDYAWAALEIRAARDWMGPFRAGLEGDAKEASGRLASSSMRAEDLTRAITDTTARLAAQETLRERLLILLEKDTDEVGDLLQIERELARVQGEIESATSYLKVLNARVSMDRMSLSYQTMPKAVTASTFESLGRAFRNFFRVMSDSLATMILFFAAILPWLIIAVPVLAILFGLIRRAFRARRA